MKRKTKSKHGFKGLNNSQVYIAKPAMTKPAPREEAVIALREMWNNDKTLKKLRKHINKLTITKTIQNGSITLGSYNDNTKVVKIYEHSAIEIRQYEQILAHEVIGHAFWYWAAKYRPEEWKQFNEFVSKLRPINQYVKNHSKSWKRCRNNGFTQYENEQHSAAVEVMMGLDDITDYHVNQLTQSETAELREHYERLHY